MSAGIAAAAGPGEPLLAFTLFAAVNVAAMLSMGLYRRGAGHTLSSTLLRLTGALILGAAVLAGLFYLLPQASVGRGALAVAFGLAFLGLLMTRFIGVRLLELDTFWRQVLVLGAGHNADLLRNKLCSRLEINHLRTRQDTVTMGLAPSTVSLRTPAPGRAGVGRLINRIPHRRGRHGFNVAGFVPGPNEARVVNAGPFVGPELPLAQYVALHHIDDVVVALDDARGGVPFDELIACKMSGVDVLDITHFFEREAGVVQLDTLRPSAMIFSRGFRQSLYRDVTKRTLDVVASLGLLAVAWPFMLLTAAGILVESRGRGSVLYRQVRVG